MDAERAIELLRSLTDPECQFVEVLGRNPEFGGPDEAIEVVRFDLVPELRERFEGRNLLECLERAHAQADAGELLAEAIEERMQDDTPTPETRRTGD